MAARKAKQKEPAKPEFPVSFETFRHISAYTQDGLNQTEPSCWNGFVSVRKYRVTIEEIEEPIEVIQARLIKLWRECDNHHHYGPLRSAAMRYGLALNSEELGVDRKRNQS